MTVLHEAAEHLVGPAPQLLVEGQDRVIAVEKDVHGTVHGSARRGAARNNTLGE
jgi:hypothetical protein